MRTKTTNEARDTLNDALHIARTAHNHGETRLRDAALGDAYTTARTYGLSFDRDSTALLHESLGLITTNHHALAADLHQLETA